MHTLILTWKELPERPKVLALWEDCSGFMTVLGSVSESIYSSRTRWYASPIGCYYDTQVEAMEELEMHFKARQVESVLRHTVP
jgi:hypothetical protein